MHASKLFRLIKTISDAIGELNLQNRIAAGDLDVGGTSAAIHAKCLICDKPVSRAKTANSKKLMSKSQSLAGYDKADDSELNAQHHASDSMFNRLTSPNVAVSTSGRAKIVSELAVIRSSIDPLPDITVRSCLRAMR